MQLLTTPKGNQTRKYRLRSTFIQLRLIAVCLMLCVNWPVFAGELGSCLDVFNGQAQNCTANEGDISGVETLSVSGEAGCLNAGDTADYYVRLALTGANTNRYDLGIYLNVLGGNAKTDATDFACFQEYLHPNTGTVNLLDGFGPFAELDGNPDDDCGDFAIADIKRSMTNDTGGLVTVGGITGPWAEVPILCNDSNNNGQLDISGCLAYANVANQNICTDFATPGSPDNEGAGFAGTKSKCNCASGDVVNPPISIAQTSSTCSCAYNKANNNYDCTVSGINTAPANLAPILPAEDNAIQAGTAAYIRYKVNDLKTSDSLDAGGTFTLGTATNGSAALGGGAEIILDPEGGRCTVGSPCNTLAPELNVLGPGETTSLEFIYANTIADELVDIVFTTWKDVDNTFSNEALRQTNTSCQVMASATYAMLGDVSARVEKGTVFLDWETLTEAATVGFDVYRQDSSNPSSWLQVNRNLVEAVQDVRGGHYSLLDTGAVPGHSYNYRIIEQEWNGARNEHGPFRVSTAQFQASTQAVRSQHKPVKVSSSSKGPDAKLAARSALALQASPGTSVKNANRQKVEKTDETKIAKEKESKAETPDALKMIVSADGFYSIKANDIAETLGLQSKKVKKLIRSKRFKLSNQGKPVAWEAGPQKQSIRFYGQMLHSRYSHENSYWLTRSKGKKIRVKKGLTGPVNPLLQGFNETATAEKDLINSAFFVPAPNDDFMFWKRMHSTDASATPFNIATPGTIDLGGQARLKAEVVRTSGPGQARIYINTDMPECAAEVNWAGAAEVELAIGQACLLPENTVYVRSLLGNFVLDSLSLTYARQYMATDGNLSFRGDDNPSMTVSGFDDRSISVYDLSKPLKPVRLKGLKVTDNGGGYAVNLIPKLTTTPYLATNAALSPDRIEAYTSARLKDTSQGASYLVIGNSAFADAAAELTDLRSTGATQAMFVDLSDIMDEFNDGNFHPAAIRDFLTYAYNNWQTAPQAVALIGKGHFDYMDDQGFGFNLMPPLVERTSNAYVPADNLLGDVNGDRIPEIAIGRIPVLSPQELGAYVEKLRTHDNAIAHYPAGQVHLVADSYDPKAGNFSADSGQIAATLPTGFDLVETYLFEPYTLTETRDRLLGSFNDGALLVNLTGHGSPFTFSGSPHTILSRTDVGMLLPPVFGQMPVVTALSCLISSYALPGLQSLGEDLVLKNNGGAIAIIGPLSLSINYRSVAMGKALLPRLLDPGSATIGAAYIAALREYVENGGDPETLLNYSMLGDPMIKLNP